MLPASTRRRACAFALAAITLIAPATAEAGAHREQTTLLISRALDGGIPNGASTNAVISNDKRYSRAIAFQSEASNLVRGDTNGVSDVFVVRRTGHIDNEGTPWTVGSTNLISRTGGHGPANGPSVSPAVDGAFHSAPTCDGFLSAASNIAAGDTNGQVDAFVARISGSSRPRRVSLPGGKQSSARPSMLRFKGQRQTL